MALGYRISAKTADRAEILIYQDIGDGFFGGLSAQQFVSDLRDLGSVRILDIRINSYGGEVFAGFAIYRILAEHPARKIVHVDGIAASIASVIAMTGDEIIFGRTATMLIHEAHGSAYSALPDQLESLAARLRAYTGAIADVYVSRTGGAIAKIRAWMAEEKEFNADEALAAGFATSIAENVEKMAAAAKPAGQDAGDIRRWPEPWAPIAAFAPAPAPLPTSPPLLRSAIENMRRMLAIRGHARINENRGAGV